MTRKRILIDTNVLLDVILDREPFVSEAADLFVLAERSRYDGIVAAISIPTVYYIAARAVGTDKAFRAVERLLHLYEVASVGQSELVVHRGQDEQGATDPVFRDYEDGVAHAAAVSAGCAGIVTRDASGFSASTIPVYTPTELLAVLR